MKKRLWIPLSIFLFLGLGKLFGQCDPQRDSMVLVALYDSTKGAEWVNTLANDQKWKIVGVPISLWKGINVNSSGCVTGIHLSDNNLQGNLPPLMSTLMALEKLTLGKNKITGRIPNFSSQNLQWLWLYDNKLEGNLPNFKNPKLEWIWVSGNRLSDTIPKFALPNLEDLDLDDNQLNRKIPNFDLPKLKKLSLANNLLDDTIPNFDLQSLEYLDISDNQLKDSIPNFNKLPNLKILWLDNNLLRGSIPNFNLPKLQSLWLFKNQLKGALPNFDKTDLDDLWISDNQLNGSIPQFNLPKLKDLRLYDNLLSGCIPTEIKINCPLIGESGGDVTGNISLFTQNWSNYWNNSEGACPITQDTNSCRYRDSIQLTLLNKSTDSTNWKNKWFATQPLSTWYGVTVDTNGCVTELNLANNKLSGALPNLNLPNLKKLDLGYNTFTGSLPNFNLPELTFLSVWGSGISGPLPTFTGIPKLKSLFLGNNKFSGNLPEWTTFKDIDTIDIGYNKNLTGAIPVFSFPKLTFFSAFDCGFTDNVPDFKDCRSLKQLTLSLNSFSGSIPDFKLPNLQILALNNNQLTGELPNLDSLTKLTDIQFQNNLLRGCFPVSYRRFCAISGSTKRNFSNNVGLPQNGDFNSFCVSSDTKQIETDTSVFSGESLILCDGQKITATTDTVYRTSFLKDCIQYTCKTTVKIKSEDLKLPYKTAITPNGNGTNDKLDFPDINWVSNKASIVIYNRWGQKVYATADYQRDWVGLSDKGEVLPEGEYFFVLTFLSSNKEPIKGSIYLFR